MRTTEAIGAQWFRSPMAPHPHPHRDVDFDRRAGVLRRRSPVRQSDGTRT
ncbi:hypothetical protein [Streptomyces sp. NPDC001194]